MTALQLSVRFDHHARIGRWARRALELEVDTYPKPGLVSQVDSGAHDDMNGALLRRSASVLEPYFVELAAAGSDAARMTRLRAIGIAAERAMLAETGGINTHRGAIFGMGLLCAAAGFRRCYGTDQTLGSIVAALWGADILGGPVVLRSHGAEVARRHGADGARREAAEGFPCLYRCALPALAEGEGLARGDAEAARVHACMRLIASVEDTNLLYRGGADGLAFAQAEAATFLALGGIGAVCWHERAVAIHRSFVARRLSPGGCADLLAMALFVRETEA